MELCRRKVTQLASMQFVHGLIQFIEQPEAFRGDAGLNDAPVFRFARASDHSAGLQAIEEAGNVRIARNEAAADFAAGQALFTGAAEDAQDIVLRAREVEGLEHRFGAAGQGVGGAQKAHEDAGFEGSPGIAFRFGGALHEATILVATTIVKRNVGGGTSFDAGGLRLARRADVHFADEASFGLRHKRRHHVRNVVRLQGF
jgi:hypothetical protein